MGSWRMIELEGFKDDNELTDRLDEKKSINILLGNHGMNKRIETEEI